VQTSSLWCGLPSLPQPGWLHHIESHPSAWKLKGKFEDQAGAGSIS